MSDFPLVTLIIPARHNQASILAVQAGAALDYPRDKLEILVAHGAQPARQRNEALKAARGELIYFLDDDSTPPRDNLKKALPYFNQPGVEILGGPNLCPADAPEWEQIFAVVMGTILAFGPSRARYLPVGSVRETSEKELILCNMAARKATLLRHGGFDETLYPNEENALMDLIQSQGGKMIYDPDFYVYRRPRATLRAFGRMLKTYGRGRAEQFRQHPTLGSALNFVPPLFCVYLILALIGPGWLRWPLWFYLLALGAQLLFLKGVPWLRRLAATALIPVAHVLYGLGFWRGLIGPLRSSCQGARIPVTIQPFPLPPAAPMREKESDKD